MKGKNLPRVGSMVKCHQDYEVILFEPHLNVHGIRQHKRSLKFEETLLVVANTPLGKYAWTTVLADDGLAYVDPTVIEEVRP